jgi:hypothetical protein
MSHDIERCDGDLADGPKRARDSAHLRTPPIADREFLAPQEQSIIGDQDRPRRPLDRWIRRRRAALRRAIAERRAAKARQHQAEQAEQVARESLAVAERALLAFADVDMSLVQRRAEEFKRAATGAPLPDLSLAKDLVTRQMRRDEAREQIIAAEATHESMVADLGHADGAVRQAEGIVTKAAIDVLIAEGVKQATELKAAWNGLWRQYDQLCALADCQLQCVEASSSITLPNDTVTLLQTMAALDERDLAHKDTYAASAGEVWCRWFKALLTDADAEETFENLSAILDRGLEPKKAARPSSPS